MSDAFDVILGQDIESIRHWQIMTFDISSERVSAEISFPKHAVILSDSIGKRVELSPQDTDNDVLCPLVSAVQCSWNIVWKIKIACSWFTLQRLINLLCLHTQQTV